MARLIVNADDFGYTDGVNRAILELHEAGALTSTTLMATGSALEDALTQLRTGGSRFRGLGVGCHVVLVEGVPVLPAEELATLVVEDGPVAGRGHFRCNLSSFVADLLRGRIRESEIEREAIAQIRLLQARGVHVTHVDTHKHTHMFSHVLRPLLRAALQCGVKAIRNPFEPGWSVRATAHAPIVRRAEVRLLSLLRPEFARLVAQAGLHTTAGAIGVLATGTLDVPTLKRLMAAAIHRGGNGETTWEMVCHPGYHDAALEAQPTRLLAAREIERMAFMETLTIQKDFSLIHYGSLAD